MIQHVNAIYEHGVLKPLGPLQLSEQELVSLSIQQVPASEPDTDDEGPTLFEMLDKAGLIGCIKDGPTDLSTNPKYMEDFGKSAT